jgi:hypothetical protein
MCLKLFLIISIEKQIPNNAGVISTSVILSDLAAFLLSFDAKSPVNPVKATVNARYVRSSRPGFEYTRAFPSSNLGYSLGLNEDQNLLIIAAPNIPAISILIIPNLNFQMLDCIFDYLSANVRETAENCKSEDEIEQWATSEGLNEARKAAWLLTKGFES